MLLMQLTTERPITIGRFSAEVRGELCLDAASTAWAGHFLRHFGKETSMEVKTMFRQASVICHSVLIQQRQSAFEPPGLLHDAAVGSPR